MRQFKILVCTTALLYAGVILAQVKEKTITITIEKDKNGKVIKSDTQTTICIRADSLVFPSMYFPGDENFVFTNNFDSIRAEILVVTDSIIKEVMHSYDDGKGKVYVHRMGDWDEKNKIKSIDSILMKLDLEFQADDAFFKKLDDCIVMSSGFEWENLESDFFHEPGDSNLHIVFRDCIGMDTCKNKKAVKVIVKKNPRFADLDKAERETLRKNGLKVEEDSPIEIVTSLKFFPNPGSGKMELQFTALEELPTKVMVYDLKGNEVYKKDMGNFVGKFSEVLEIKGAASGTFVLVIQRGKQQVSKKIILE